MTLPLTNEREGGRPIGLGRFIRLFLGGELEAPELDPGTLAIVGMVRADRRRGAPQRDIWARYRDFLFVAWGQELVERWREQGREIPDDPEEYEQLERVARARIPQRLSRMRVASFYRYFRNLRTLGWVEPSGEEEGSLLGGEPDGGVQIIAGQTLLPIPQPRRYYRLTRRGLEVPVEDGWRNPLLLLYPERGVDYYRGTARQARERRGVLPRRERLPTPPEYPQAPPPLPPPEAPPTGVPPFTLAERPGRGAAQQLIRYLRRLDELEPEAPEVQEEMARLARDLEEWMELISDAYTREEEKDEPDDERLEALQEMSDALVDAQSALEEGEGPEAIEALERSFPPGVSRIR